MDKYKSFTTISGFINEYQCISDSIKNQKKYSLGVKLKNQQNLLKILLAICINLISQNSKNLKEGCKFNCSIRY